MLSTKTLKESDSVVAEILRDEVLRKENSLELIASENSTSEAVMEVCGSPFTDKYCEGYPGKRYYGGCAHYDKIEDLAIDRAKELFGAEAANVQAHSGASANIAVIFSLVNPGDTIMGASLAHGGHLTHGCPVNFSGKYFNAVSYGVDEETHLYQADEVIKLAKETRPKLIICGASAYPRQIEWEVFRRAADEVGAYLMADVAHYAGLIAAGEYDSPIGVADVVTTTTHKTLRGPRGGLILCKEKFLKQINKMVFPGMQGGPLMHQVAGKAVAFGEALQPEFKTYQKQVVLNARRLASTLQELGFDLVSGGTDSHQVIMDLRSKALTGKVVEAALGEAGITVNKNAIPNDPKPPAVTSGIRLGTAALTTRGFGEGDFSQVGELINEAIESRENSEGLASVKAKVQTLCAKYPLYPHRLG